MIGNQYRSLSFIISTRIIKSILKNERVCRDKYQNRKSTGTSWLWQQNEIPLPHNNCVHKYHFFVFCLYSSCVYLCRIVMWKWYFILLPKLSCSCPFSVLIYIPRDILFHFLKMFFIILVLIIFLIKYMMTICSI